VRFNLPDRDVFAIDANNLATAPTAFAHVGTVLFNMAVNPVSGKLYVSNTEARNESRFEGPGVFAGHTVRGHLHEARISIISGATVTPRHLNKHINYAVVPSPAGVKNDSLAIPTGMAVTANGATLYVAAFGRAPSASSTRASSRGTRSPRARSTTSGDGRRAERARAERGEESPLCLHPLRQLHLGHQYDDGEPDRASPRAQPRAGVVVNGRPILYDAVLTSSNGEASCASCHIFGDFDSLAWDLGNPDDVPLNNPNPFGSAAARASIR